MPRFDFKCLNCGNIKEVFRSYNSTEPVFCGCPGHSEMVKCIALPAPLIGSNKKKGEVNK